MKCFLEITLDSNHKSFQKSWFEKFTHSPQAPLQKPIKIRKQCFINASLKTVTTDKEIFTNPQKLDSENLIF